ncbi:MAG: hypothetical protein KA712_09640 [Myxococcales bacterium]|nr:hypothetical protein [Myxococcales bacterium]
MTSGLFRRGGRAGLLAVLVLSGCQGGDPAVSRDGGIEGPKDGANPSRTDAFIQCSATAANSSPLAFGFSQGVELARLAAGSQVVSENGHEFIFIDGKCRYWVASRSVHGPLGETRTGVLSPPEVQSIEIRLKLNTWSALEGVHKPEVQVNDASPLRLAVNGLSVLCTDSCSSGQPQVVAIFKEARVLLKELFDKGTALDGPVRIAVVPLDGTFVSWNSGPAPWPLSKPLESFVSPSEALPRGKGHLVEGADAQALRRLRDMQRAETFAPLKDVGSSIPIGSNSSSVLHALYLRDALPIEDEMGLVPLIE